MSSSHSFRALRAIRLLAVAVLALAAGNCGDDPSYPPPPDIIGAPTGFAATINASAVHLSWANGTSTTSVRVLRKLTQEPSGPDDATATLVYAGPGVVANDPLVGLLPSTTDSMRVYNYAVFGCGADGSCEHTGARATASPTVVQCLKGGGYTIYWRHAAADVCTDRLDLGTADTTSVPDWWRDCRIDCDSTYARQLNPTGIAQAAQIGDDLRARGVPFGRVLSSEFCRCVQTAQNMNLTASVELDHGLTLFVYDELHRCQACFDHLAVVPAPGGNTALIGHAGFAGSCNILSSLAWGEAAIYKPDGAGGARYITRVQSGAWTALP